MSSVKTVVKSAAKKAAPKPAKPATGGAKSAAKPAATAGTGSAAAPLSDIGLIGLAVMGQNLALNIADHGFAISVFNRSPEKTREFVAKHAGATPGRLAG
ncbi:MAG: hypothetical protein LBR07_05565, partial [Puniceicoccales bacterium]|nr:hypothetical protein [Puniceicoccales bacterium]